MKAFKVVMCSCDGRRIGKVWNEEFYFDKAKAETALKQIVEDANNGELARKDSFCVRERKIAEKENKHWFRLYEQDEVEGIKGLCVWCYGQMVYLKEIELE